MSKVKRAIRAGESEFSISGMVEHDLLEVVEIEESCGLSRWGWSAYYAELAHPESALMLVARATIEREGGQLVGGYIAARIVGDEMHINNVAVRPKFRRHGLGSALLSAVLKEAARLGCQSAWLEVRASNLTAQALYSTFGFRSVGRRRNYYSHPTEDALLMTTTLGE